MCYLVSITVFDGDGKVLEAACRTYVCVCVYVCVVSVTVKRPVLPPCVVNGRSRNPYYYYYVGMVLQESCRL